MRRELVPLVVIPGFRKWRRVFACADRIVPLPTGEFAVLGMIGHEDLSGSRGFAGDLLEHGELVRIDRSVFVNTSLNVPASEIATISPGKCAGAESPNRCALPVAIVDICLVFSD